MCKKQYLLEDTKKLLAAILIAVTAYFVWSDSVDAFEYEYQKQLRFGQEAQQHQLERKMSRNQF